MWIAFFCGMVLGACLGAIILGLVSASRDFYDNDGEF